MKLEFDVNMTTAKLYDYMLSHTMRSFSGLVAEILGIFLVACSFMMTTGYRWMYFAAGIVVIFYLPVSLYFAAKRQMLTNPVFKEVLHYTLDDEGIRIKVNDQEDSQSWEGMHRARSTGRSIIIYTNRINACIFPKEDLGDKLSLAIKIISTHMPAGKVNIR